MFILYEVVSSACQRHQSIPLQLWHYVFSYTGFKKSMKPFYPAIGCWMMGGIVYTLLPIL